MSRFRFNRTRRTALFASVAAGAAVGALFSVWQVPALVNAARARQEEFRRNYSALAVLRADRFRETKQFAQAYSQYRLALSSALDASSRNDAALGMALLLLDRAEQEPEPYALMARQYVEALLDTETRPDRLREAWRALMGVARAQEDTAGMMAAARHVRELLVCDVERAQLLISEWDYLLASGSWPDLDSLTHAAEPLSRDERWREEFEYRQALAKAKTLADPAWFDAWARHAGAEEDAALAEARSRLFRETIARFERLTESRQENIVQGALFHSARLHALEDDLDAADRLMALFLVREPFVHIKDALLLSVSLARQRGEVRTARELVRTFLRRYAWHEALTDDFLAVVEQAVEHAPAMETLALIDQYVLLPVAEPIRRTLLLQAGDLARDAGDLARAAGYYAEAETSALAAGEDSIAARALFKRAELKIRQGEDEAAWRLLTNYVVRYPSEESYGDALFALLDTVVRLEKGDGEIVRLALAAATATPEDARTPETLLNAARRIEAMGLFEQAQVQYAKIMLLQFLRIGRAAERVALNDESVVARAMLGNARCLLRLKEPVRADHVLRNLCALAEPGAVRSEAAWLWASLALENEQLVEARRRLGLVDMNLADPAIAGRVALETLLIGLRTGEATAESAWAVLPMLAAVPAEEEHAAFLREAYRTCFRTVIEEQGVQAARRFLEESAAGPHAALLPLGEMSMRSGRLVLEQEGNAALIAFLSWSAALIEQRQPQAVRDLQSLGQAAGIAEKAREIVERYF